MDTFALLKVVAGLVLPPGSLAVAAIASLALLWLGWRRSARLVIVLAVVETIGLSFPPISDSLMRILEDDARAAAAKAPACCYEAIVVLGGGVSPAMPPERLEPDLSDAADRVWEAARLYRRGTAPRVVVSGGGFMARPGQPETTEAEAMRGFLIALGVPDSAIILEPTSINTIGNIRNVRALVKDGKVALVTSGYHMPRALRLAANAKLDVAAFPVDFRALPSLRAPWDNWLPSVDSLATSCFALREVLALAFDRRGGMSAP